MHRSLRRLMVALALAALVPAGAAVPTASAHVDVVSSSPAPGAVTGTGVRKVRIRFSGAVRSGTIVVRRTATGAKASIGSGGRDPRSVSRLVVKLRSGLAAGRYTVRWTVVSADGHRESGSFRFRMR